LILRTVFEDWSDPVHDSIVAMSSPLASGLERQLGFSWMTEGFSLESSDRLFSIVRAWIAGRVR
jgi:hypothetical protein